MRNSQFFKWLRALSPVFFGILFGVYFFLKAPIYWSIAQKIILFSAVVPFFSIVFAAIFILLNKRIRDFPVTNLPLKIKTDRKEYVAKIFYCFFWLEWARFSREKSLRNFIEFQERKEKEDAKKSTLKPIKAKDLFKK